jgi:ActR/RegA family two-component response regulator
MVPASRRKSRRETVLIMGLQGFAAIATAVMARILRDEISPVKM